MIEIKHTIQAIPTTSIPMTLCVKKYGIGIDPGYVKLGVGILDIESGKMTMACYNLTKWSRTKHYLKGRDMWFIAKSFVDQYG